MSAVIDILLIVISVMIAFLLGRMHGRLSARRNTKGDPVLEYSSTTRTIPIAVNCIWLLLMIVVLYFINKFQSGITGAWALPLVFLLIELPLWAMFAQAWGVFFVLTGEGIRKYPLWTRDTCLKWSDVRLVSFRPQSGEFVIEGNETRMKLSRDLDGLGDFARCVATRVPPQKWSSARLQIESVLSGQSGYSS